MNIGEKMNKAFNEQIQAEFDSAYLYLSMAAWFEDQNFSGFANWMKKQYAEETEHAMKMFDYVVSRGGRVELAAIDGPRISWESPLDAFKDTLEHEKEVTKRIHNLMEIALDKKDYASVEFLNWYVKEQVEEEATASGIVAALEKVGDSPVGLFTFDGKLGSR